jgi:hypothetical protein
MAEPTAWTTAESVPVSADSLLLDQFPNTHVALSLRRQSANYSGPVVTIRRGSDDATKDFGLDGDKLDVAGIESWLSGSEGYVTKWHEQRSGGSVLAQDQKSNQPRIADESGTVFTDSENRIAIKFDRSRDTFLTIKPEFGGTNNASTWQIENSLTYVVGEKGSVTDNPRRYIVSQFEPFGNSGERATLVAEGGGYKVFSGVSIDGGTYSQLDTPGWWGMRFHDGEWQIWSDNEVIRSQTVSGTQSTSKITLGVNTGSTSSGYDGFISETAILDGQPSKSEVFDVYDIANDAWGIGPQGYNRGAILPQSRQWQIDLYDWMETITIQDVTLPDGTLTYDNSYSSTQELADLWIQIEGLTASSVTRRIPDWYLLDAGNGKGIEATGDVRANHNPKGGSYGGNPPRSWQNEPAYWYHLDIPLSGGGQGNPWHKDPAMGRRAMIVSSADMMMHAKNFGAGSSGYDFMGKAFLGMAEAYRWAGEVMPSNVQDAYEKGMGAILDNLTAKGPKAVNTNMDIFALQGAAELYMATDDAALQQKCVEMVRAALFGYTDGELGNSNKHRVFAVGDRKGGVFNPAGFIMEGDTPDIFYGGESLYHLVGALQAVTDRETGSVPSDWTFLEDVVQRFQEWLTFQSFHDPRRKSPGTDNSDPLITAGAGFSGRTGAGVPGGQGRSDYMEFTLADRWDELAYLADDKTIWATGMEQDISDKISQMNSRMDSRYTASDPDVWEGFSPWTKKVPYLPPKGWYDNLRNLDNNDDPLIEKWPALEDGRTWNRTFGGNAETWNGDPLGKEYWSYKGTDSNGDAFGFYVEASRYQGTYPGWFGGKIETFWTKETGVLFINRHGKTGCDNSSEDSFCWSNLDDKAGHHVWGRDENGKGFTTLLTRGRVSDRTTNYDTEGSPPTVTVTTPMGETGMGGTEGAGVIEGSFSVENKFEVVSDGLTVTHTLTSDETDQVNMLWAGLPVYLRHNNPNRAGLDLQQNMEDTRIEYWDGSSWVELPFDTDSDGVPEIVSTSALRLGRDYEDGQGMRYGYVDLDQSRKMRRSKNKYYDPYQTKTGVRTVHIDLHGDPGTTKTLPASKSVSYTIQTTDPTSEEDPSASHVISLKNGWNIASTFISPSAPAMDSVFSGLQSEITVVENEAGEHYRPAENINEIGQWNSEEAYRIHAESDVTLTIQGDSLGSPSIALEEGWNLVPYFPSSPLSVQEALSSITDDLDLVKDEAGRVYLPEMDPDVLEQMEPGEGYKVYVRQSTTLTYPDGSN